MSFLATGRVNYRARLNALNCLAQRYSSAQQILGFYGHIARFQKDFYEQLPKLWGKQALAPADGDLRSDLNLPHLAGAIWQVSYLDRIAGPGPACPHTLGN